MKAPSCASVTLRLPCPFVNHIHERLWAYQALAEMLSPRYGDEDLAYLKASEMAQLLEALSDAMLDRIRQAQALCEQMLVHQRGLHPALPDEWSWS